LFSTDKQSFGLSLIYNIDNKYTNIGYGLGWQTNYSMIIDEIGSDEEYSITDGTGNTIHYYHTTCDSRITYSYPFTGACYLAEDGSGNILVREFFDGDFEGAYVLTAEQMKYNFGTDTYLDSIVDVRSSLSITIIRNSTNKNQIDYIKDSSQNIIDLTYNTNGDLEYAYLKLKQYDGSLHTIEYTYHDYLSITAYNDYAFSYAEHFTIYNTNNNPVSSDIQYYESDENARLVSAYDNLGVETVYTFNTTTNQVENVAFYSSEYLFEEYSYSYQTDKTVITDSSNNYVEYSFDDYGHTISLLGSNGVFQSFTYLNIFAYDAPEVINYYLNNKLLSQTSTERMSENLIENYSFEIDREHYSSWYLKLAIYVAQY